MTKYKFVFSEELYDEVSRVLTNFEACDGSDKIEQHNATLDMYSVLCGIQTRMATAEEVSDGR